MDEGLGEWLGYGSPVMLDEGWSSDEQCGSCWSGEVGVSGGELVKTMKKDDGELPRVSYGVRPMMDRRADDDGGLGSMGKSTNGDGELKMRILCSMNYFFSAKSTVEMSKLESTLRWFSSLRSVKR
ncbi:hypothetical protein V6N13_022037 [Hibiscus sabdariffa]|uniref:Uncharacterized protein n=1 Tax=Hibiscus sabdariffa TaxID=183260 RepID=A0ABR2CQY7_9ROSI